MSNLSGVIRQLKQARNRAAKELENLDGALNALRGSGLNSGKRRALSVAARRKIAAAQRARWARFRAANKK